MMRQSRRQFIRLAAGAAAFATTLPAAPDNYWCDCHLVQYFRQPAGHYAASHFNGQRMTYGLHRQHMHLHRHGRMQMLMVIGKHYRPLTDSEREELQVYFLRLAHQDARLLNA
jgi:hypothetical protein